MTLHPYLDCHSPSLFSPNSNFYDHWTILVGTSNSAPFPSSSAFPTPLSPAHPRLCQAAFDNFSGVIQHWVAGKAPLPVRFSIRKGGVILGVVHRYKTCLASPALRLEQLGFICPFRKFNQTVAAIAHDFPYRPARWVEHQSALSAVRTEAHSKAHRTLRTRRVPALDARHPVGGLSLVDDGQVLEWRVIVAIWAERVGDPVRTASFKYEELKPVERT
eukprot:CAMPEP_0185270428 /NCGR_PEP_ID=MMETSP1359-20130426/42301_1 /TAXON_ID=552665 /ORGANISM="Bigelowiella longifila, Strain CCMP242" /LENGTH=217 /DNA_ID=CAMNT_0027861977 /DNA_START=487 /DNA_END=1136 /DNA_ORIENTATION=+